MKKLICVSLCLALGLSLAACGKKEETQEISVPIYEAKAVKYRTAKAEIGDISERYVQKGSYGYPYEETITFGMSGQIDQLVVTQDQGVSKGDLLCTLFSDELDEQIETKQVYLDQAKNTYAKLYNEGVSYNELQMAYLDLQIQQLEYDHLLEQKDKYNVYAPCDGYFTSGGIRGGQFNRFAWVNAGQTFGKTSDNSEEFLICRIFDNPLNNVNFGTAVKLTQGANEASGKVVDIIHDDNGDYSSYTYVVRPDQDSGLFTFGDVEVSFNVYSRLDTVIVPTKAVKTVGERKFVNLLIDGVKVEQDVEVGIVDGSKTEITSGLVGGEELILN